MHGYNWKTGLPKESRHATVPPVALQEFEEKSAYARLVKGFDSQGKLCYHYHTYAISRERFDEEGQYEESEAYRQEVTAWRLYTGGWLVRRYEAREQNDCGGRLVPPSYEALDALPTF